MDDTPEQIEAAIAALEAQRAVLGDAIAEMALAPLRDKLAAARSRARLRGRGAGSCRSSRPRP
jgi:hypothetical protein